MAASGLFPREGNEASYLKQSAENHQGEECNKEEQTSPLMEFWLR